MERWRWGRVHNPMRGLLHGAAALAAIAGAWLLVARAVGIRQVAAGMIFGFSLVAMFTVSALYHSVGWQQGAKAFMQRLDHSMIFLLVAGTVTPFALVVADGWMRTALLTGTWTIALVGIVLKFVLPKVRTALSALLQHLIGWSGLVAIPVIWQRVGPGCVSLVLGGGALYSLGTVVFATKRPRLLPRFFSYHELFHLLVIGGSLCHFLSVLWYVMPYGRTGFIS
ncbi:MAG: PAQR family membrane homeostasis protein TrhA [Actinomycetota bacterium]